VQWVDDSAGLDHPVSQEIDGTKSDDATQRVNPRIRWHIHASWIAGALLLAYAYGFVNAMVRASENIDECRHVVASLSSKYQVPPSVSTPGSPAIFCDAAVHFPLLNVYDNVFIYGVVMPANQNAIEASLRDFHATAGTRPILLQFFDKENWRTWADPNSGRSGGNRGPETAIRKVWIR
jgi:hypothetical protein